MFYFLSRQSTFTRSNLKPFDCFFFIERLNVALGLQRPHKLGRFTLTEGIFSCKALILVIIVLILHIYHII